MKKSSRYIEKVRFYDLKSSKMSHPYKTNRPLMNPDHTNLSREIRIKNQLQETLAPIYLLVENESPHHHVPEGSEMHFKLIAVSDRFTSLTLIARHRLINQLLAKEFETGLHALTMHLYTPEEWVHQNQLTPPISPPCAKKNKII